MDSKQDKDQPRMTLGDIWSTADESSGWFALLCGAGL